MGISDFTRTGIAFQRIAALLGGSRVQSRTVSTGVVLGMTSNGQEVYWPIPSLAASSVAVLGATGSGKTIATAMGLLGEMARDRTIDPGQRSSYLIVDPKSDLLLAILQGLSALVPERLPDVVYLSPFAAGGFPFNLRRLPLGRTPLDIRALQLANLVSTVSTAAGAVAHLGVGARQADVLLHIILGALDCSHPKANLLWALDALVERQGLKTLGRLTNSARARTFLENAFLGDELRASCSSRLRTAFAASEQLERLVTADTCLSFEEILSPGRIVMIDLGQPPGGLSTLQELWANLLVRLAIEYLMERPSPWAGHHTRVVCDEAQVVAPVLSDAAESVLVQGRSRGISLVLLSQGTTLLQAADRTGVLLRVLLNNTPCRILGRLNAPDAELFAKELSTRPGIEETLSEVRSRFVSQITNLQAREFIQLLPGKRRRFTSQEVDVEVWKEALSRQADAVDRARARFSLPERVPVRLTLSQAAAEGESAAGRRPRTPPTGSSSPPRKRWG